jgi:hypothetical protein
MNRVIAMLGVIVLATAATAYAQQPASPADPHHPQGQASAPAPSTGQTSPNPAAPMGGMMPMMEMCREMMSGHSMMGYPMMRGGMTGGGGQPMDPKAMSQMMEMRGEMMKAMGDIMLKHAKRMQGTPSPK